MEREETLRTIYRSDPERERLARRYGMGQVVSTAGGMISVDVGATLPMGISLMMEIPAARGFAPAVGQVIALLYPGASLHASYGAAIGSAAAVPPATSSHGFDQHSGVLNGANIDNGTVGAAKLTDGAALAEILDDDGPGCLLDADKLDGVEGAGYALVANGVTNGDSHDHDGGDGAPIPVAGLGAAVSAAIQGTPTITVGGEAADTINVAVQLKDLAGTNLAAAHVCQVWLSDAAGGAVTGTAPDGAVAIGTNGTIIAAHTAKTHLVVASDGNGQFDLDITESGAATWYLNLEYQGKLFSSAAITFT